MERTNRNLRLPLLILLNIFCVWPVMHGFDGLPHAFLLGQSAGLIAALSGCALWYELCRRFAGSRLAGTRFFRTVSADSYGLYLLHPMMIYLFFYHTRDIPVQPWLLASSSIILSTFLSLWGVKLIRLLRLQRFIGEDPPSRRA